MDDGRDDTVNDLSLPVCVCVCVCVYGGGRILNGEQRYEVLYSVCVKIEERILASTDNPLLRPPSLGRGGAGRSSGGRSLGVWSIRPSLVPLVVAVGECVVASGVLLQLFLQSLVQTSHTVRPHLGVEGDPFCQHLALETEGNTLSLSFPLFLLFLALSFYFTVDMRFWQTLKTSRFAH